MELNDQLQELLSEISPTDAQQSALRDAHIRLRERLMADDDLKPWIVEIFLQGSYKRHTGIRPGEGDKPDVDTVVVTRLDRSKYTPEQAMNVLVPFLNRYYAGKWKKKGRSIGIELANVKLDVVITSAPSEAGEKSLIEVLRHEYDFGDMSGHPDDWKSEPLWIPDREARNWQRTHPRAQIFWTQDKNRRTNGHFIHVVKLVKWWWQNRHSEQEYPKSYPLEHMVGDCCPDGSDQPGPGLHRNHGGNGPTLSALRGHRQRAHFSGQGRARAQRPEANHAPGLRTVPRQGQGSGSDRPQSNEQHQPGRKRPPVEGDIRQPLPGAYQPARLHSTQPARPGQGRPFRVTRIG